MKLLIVTQVVDQTHSNMALIHRWIGEFAKHCEQVSVICLYEGEHSLPKNVHVYSLGKERGRLPRFRYALRFWNYLWKLRHEYDTVFVHMNPEYILLGGFIWRMSGRKIALWYTHKSVDLKLRIGTFLANVIFSASRESFRLPTKKLRIMGHGIDTELFAPQALHIEDLNIITVSRITKSKRLIEMLFALDVLYTRGIPFQFSIIGAPIFEHDKAYEKEIQREIARRPYASDVHFIGMVPYRELPNALGRGSVFINLSKTGSIDRAVLEAMSIGLAPVTSNEAFREMLTPFGLYVKEDSPKCIADTLVHAKNVDRAELSRYVREYHSLQRLIPAMFDIMRAP